MGEEEKEKNEDTLYKDFLGEAAGADDEEKKESDPEEKEDEKKEEQEDESGELEYFEFVHDKKTKNVTMNKATFQMLINKNFGVGG